MKTITLAVLVLTQSAWPQASSTEPAGPGRGTLGGAGAAAESAPRGRQLSKLIEGPDLGYKPVANPLPLPAGMAYGAVAGVAINSKGHIFVYMGVRPDQALNHLAFGPLVEFDADGKFIRSWGKELEVQSPHGFRIDSGDNFWLTDIGDHTVTKLNPKGEMIFRLGTKGKAGVWQEPESRTFNQPTDLALASNGDIFVAQGHGGGDPRVLRFDKNGKLINSWSGKVSGPGAFTNVHSITLDPQGQVWVGDRTAKKILIFNTDGTFVRDIQMPVYVCGFYVHKDQQLYMTSGWDGQILKLNWNGGILAATGKPGVGLNKYGEAEEIAISAKDEIFVADKVNDVIQKLIRN